LDSLQKLKEKVDKRIEGLQEETREQEAKHKAKLQQLHERFDLNFRHFKEIDKRVSRVGSAAATIGNRLEAVDSQRERGLQCKQLFDTFLELNHTNNNPDQNDDDDEDKASNITGPINNSNQAQKGRLFSDPGRLLSIFLEYDMDMSKYRIPKNNMKKNNNNNNNHNTQTQTTVAVFKSVKYEQLYEKVLLCKQLYSMSQELDVDRLQMAKHSIILISKELEKKILQHFETALHQNDYQTMKVHCTNGYPEDGGDDNDNCSYLFL
jgi:hypothetical protein